MHRISQNRLLIRIANNTDGNDSHLYYCLLEFITQAFICLYFSNQVVEKYKCSACDDNSGLETFTLAIFFGGSDSVKKTLTLLLVIKIGLVGLDQIAPADNTDQAF